MPAPDHEDFYRVVPLADPHHVGLGGALISLVEPHDGHERDFSRWYEDDHFYAGALCMPWLFAGRRYVATRAMRDARLRSDAGLIDPLTAGCYLHLFWIASGHVDDLATWAQATNENLRATPGRIHAERSHVFTHFHNYDGDHQPLTPGTRTPKDYQVLDAEFPALVMEILGPVDGASRDDLDAWITSDYLPWLHDTSPATVAHSLRFSPRPPPQGNRSSGNQAQATLPVDQLAVLLHFLPTDPDPHWAGHLAASADHIASSGVATHFLSAPFRPVTFGTDRYVDELR